jgi:glycosyltransferase involved in cell wall biosynthesis
VICMPEKTPVAIFAYNRPNHLRKTLEALCNADQYEGRDTYIFCDGPKTEGDAPLIDEVKDEAERYSRRSNVNVIKKEKNYGLAGSIIEGVTQLLKKHATLIILEDDIIISSKALKYFDDALMIYQNRKDIFSVGSYVPETLWNNFPSDYDYNTFLIPRMQCWGWATWSCKWNLFKNYKTYYDSLMSSKKAQLGYRHIIGEDSFKTLRACIDNGKDVWACKWVLTHFNYGSSCVCPRYPLSKNIGLDGSGTNCGTQANQPTFISEEEVDRESFNLGYKINTKIFERFMNRKISFNDEPNRLNSNYIFTP